MLAVITLCLIYAGNASRGTASLALSLGCPPRMMPLLVGALAYRTPQLLAMGTIGSSIQQPMAAFPGGLLLRDASKNIVGGIGVSGAAADEDEHCAITAARAVGLTTDPATSALPRA